MSLREIIKERVHEYVSGLLESGRLKEDAAKKAASTWWSDELAARVAAKLLYRVRERLAEKSLTEEGEERLRGFAEWAEANGYGPEDVDVEHWIEAGPYEEMRLHLIVGLINGAHAFWKASSSDVIVENLPKTEFLKFRREEEELEKRIKELRAGRRES